MKKDKTKVPLCRAAYKTLNSFDSTAIRFRSKFLAIRMLHFKHHIMQLTSFADVPQAVLGLGKSLNASNLKEGDDVYFECSVRANPKPYKISWRFNVSLFTKIFFEEI